MEAAQMEKTCCVTGHRDMDTEQMEEIRDALKKEVEKAVEDGYVSFLSSFTGPAEQVFAETVLDLKKDHPDLRLYAVIPYRTKLVRLMDQEAAKRLLDACEDIIVLKEEYQPNVYTEQNRYLAEHSDRAIIVYDGREKGATVNMIRQVHRNKKEMREIPVGLKLKFSGGQRF